MKKLIKSLMIVFIVIVMSSCGKKAISSDDFKSKLKELNFSIVDVLNQVQDNTDIKGAYIAVSNDYKIEFYELSDKYSAAFFYANNKINLENSKSESGIANENSGYNYIEYIVENEETYQGIKCVENTIIFFSIPKDFKDNIRGVLTDIGY